jgi:hypothetical protein
MKTKVIRRAELNLALWFAVLSPLIGALLGILGVFLLE